MQEYQRFIFIHPKIYGCEVNCPSKPPLVPEALDSEFSYYTVGFNTRRQNFKCGDAHLMNLLSLVQKFRNKTFFII